MAISIEAVYKKIMSLRTQYSRLVKALPNGSGSADCRTVAAVLQKLLIKSGWWVTTSLFSVLGVIRAPDRTQLNRRVFEHVQNSVTDKNFRFFSFSQFFSVVRVIIARRALWSLLRSDSTQLPVELIWVESNRALWSRLKSKKWFVFFLNILCWHFTMLISQSMSAVLRQSV